MKIKTKKQMNLPQLIEWAWNNPDLSHEMTFISKGYERVQINLRYNPRGVLNLDILNGTNISNDIQFTLEEFEEISEDTVIPKIVSIGRKNENEINIHHYCRISQFIDNKDFNYYVLNDDDTLTLIWCDGKLIKE